MVHHLDMIGKRLSDAIALLGAIGIIAMLVHVTGDVVARNVFGRPLPATVEIVSRYYMVALAFLPLAWAERRGDMITVDIFGALYKGVVRTIVLRFAALLTCIVYMVLAYTTFQAAMREFAVGTYVISLRVAVPVWAGYFILPAGFAVAALVTALRAILPARPEPETAPNEH